VLPAARTAVAPAGPAWAARPSPSKHLVSGAAASAGAASLAGSCAALAAGVAAAAAWPAAALLSAGMSVLSWFTAARARTSICAVASTAAAAWQATCALAAHVSLQMPPSALRSAPAGAEVLPRPARAAELGQGRTMSGFKPAKSTPLPAAALLANAAMPPVRAAIALRLLLPPPWLAAAAVEAGGCTRTQVATPDGPCTLRHKVQSFYTLPSDTLRKYCGGKSLHQQTVCTSQSGKAQTHVHAGPAAVILKQRCSCMEQP